MNTFVVTLGDKGNCTSKQLLNNNMTMQLSSENSWPMKIVTCALVTIFIVHLFIRRQYNIIDASSSFLKTSFFAIFLYLFKVEHAGGAAKLIIKNHQNRQNVGKQCLINLQRIFFSRSFLKFFQLF